jgi:hypothetical protein
MLPGAGLLQRAYDATKLAGALMQHRRERALVLAEERQTQMAQVHPPKLPIEILLDFALSIDSVVV